MAILMMDSEKKERIQNYANETIDFIYGKTKDEIEIAYLLKMLVEGYQDTKQMTIPIDMEYKRIKKEIKEGINAEIKELAELGILKP